VHAIAALARTLNAFDPQHTGTTTYFVDRANMGATPIVQQPSRHRFDDLVDQVQARDKCSRHQALSTARLENPNTYMQYQRWHAGNSAQEQYESRLASDDNFANKAAPARVEYPSSSLDNHPSNSGKNKLKSHRIGRVRRHDQQVKKTYESACLDELRKGASNGTVAQHRVLQLYGGSLPREASSIAKAEHAASVAEDFRSAADELLQASDVMSRCEALRAARKSHPGLFKRFQAS